MKHSNREDIEADWQAPRNLKTPTEAQEDLDDDEVPGNRTTRAIPCCVIFVVVIVGAIYLGWHGFAAVKGPIWDKLQLNPQPIIEETPAFFEQLERETLDKVNATKQMLDDLESKRKELDALKQQVDAAVDAVNPATP